ncbi:MAG: hypothetical protein AAFY41_10380, partial [Bacteroidota bacterium]
MDEGLRNALIAISAILAYSFLISGATPVSVYRKLRNALYYHFGYTINRRFIIRNIKAEYKDVLEGAFYYYNHLNQGNKTLFEKRVQKFIDKKEF